MDIKKFDEFIQFFCEPAFLLSQEGEVLSLNFSARKLLGATTDDILGKPLTALVCDSPPQVTNYLRSCVSTGQPVLGALSWRCFERSQPLPCHGQAFSAEYVLLRFVPELACLHDTLAEPVSAAQSLQEITRQRWLPANLSVSKTPSKSPGSVVENRLQATERHSGVHRERLARFHRFSILSEMATGIAHEINQPLTGIATYAQGCRRQLESGRADISELLVILDKISEQARQSGEFVHSLRKLAKKHGGNRERCDMNQLVRDSLKLAAYDGCSPEVPIEAVLTKVRLPIVADPLQIQQTLLHLLHNAIEATMETGVEDAVISITTTIDDERGLAVVAVTDSGPGLLAEARDKLFDPFYTTKAQGLGMGLAVCRTVITSHAGRIRFNDHLEGGTTFYITLPLALSSIDDD